MVVHVLMVAVLLHTGQLGVMNPVVFSTPERCIEAVTLTYKSFEENPQWVGRIKKLIVECRSATLLDSE